MADLSVLVAASDRHESQFRIVQFLRWEVAEWSCLDLWLTGAKIGPSAWMLNTGVKPAREHASLNAVSDRIVGRRDPRQRESQCSQVFQVLNSTV